jgi:hypothetical protein
VYSRRLNSRRFHPEPDGTIRHLEGRRRSAAVRRLRGGVDDGGVDARAAGAEEEIGG